MPYASEVSDLQQARSQPNPILSSISYLRGCKSLLHRNIPCQSVNWFPKHDKDVLILNIYGKGLVKLCILSLVDVIRWFEICRYPCPLVAVRLKQSSGHKVGTLTRAWCSGSWVGGSCSSDRGVNLNPAPHSFRCLLIH